MAILALLMWMAVMEQVQLVKLEGWQEWQLLYLQVYVLGRLSLQLAEAAQADQLCRPSYYSIYQE